MLWEGHFDEKYEVRENNWVQLCVCVLSVCLRCRSISLQADAEQADFDVVQ